MAANHDISVTILGEGRSCLTGRDFGIVGDAHAADDMAQDTWLAAAHKRDVSNSHSTSSLLPGSVLGGDI